MQNGQNMVSQWSAKVCPGDELLSNALVPMSNLSIHDVSSNENWAIWPNNKISDFVFPSSFILSLKAF